MVLSVPLCLLSVTNLVVNIPGDTASATGGHFNGSNSGDLRGLLNFINQNSSGGGDYSITFSAPSVTLQNPLPFLNENAANTITITGPATIDGQNEYRGLYARQGTIHLSDLTIQNTCAEGVDSVLNGGGLGAGAGLLVNQATVSLHNMTFQNCQAKSGLGGHSERDIGNGSSNFSSGKRGFGGGGAPGVEGGFGGGGGRSSSFLSTAGGIGGSEGGVLAGGDGAALGGAIFVNAGNIGNSSGSGGSISSWENVVIQNGSSSNRGGQGGGSRFGDIFYVGCGDCCYAFAKSLYNHNHIERYWR